ncbi:MAG: BolA/IbaG family iron-sulfur metabolism protein [Kangiellaceae bacterium]|nr:BolA/IbaG family iron-sulfur metabolism protein [Kangiellaceae bacterium]
MTELEIKEMIEQAMTTNSVEVGGDGYHFEARVVSDEFAGKRPVARQQLVYAILQEQISSGELHAISLKTLTIEEAAKA